MGLDNSFEKMMQNFRMLIWNSADDPVISARIEPFTYNAEILDAAKILFTQTEQLDEDQQKEYAEQRAKTRELNVKTKYVDTDYKQLREFCKFAFEDNIVTWNALQLGNPVPDAFPQWHTHLSHFYNLFLADPNTATPILPFGYTVESLTAQKNALMELKTIQQEREREIGDAQRATKERDAKFEELSIFCKRLSRLLRLLFVGDDAQYLEKVGLLARS